MRTILRIMVWIAAVFLIALSGWSKPLPVETRHTVVIDTDCAIDDMRAISLLLARPEVVIKGILISDGSLPPDVGYDKIRALLQPATGINTGRLRANTEWAEPEWREFNRRSTGVPTH
jgi:hypothetical protein